MPRKTLQQVREEGHWPEYGSRQTRARAHGNNRPLYVASVICECGWKFEGDRPGFQRPDAEREHKKHLREVGGL